MIERAEIQIMESDLHKKKEVIKSNINPKFIQVVVGGRVENHGT